MIAVKSSVVLALDCKRWCQLCASYVHVNVHHCCAFKLFSIQRSTHRRHQQSRTHERGRQTDWA